jgi:tetratricopeptide (TPR) repeat protein
MSKRKHAIDAHFQSGVRLHSAGRLQEAEQVYRQIIAAAPGHADSYHMLGVIASQCGQPEAAVACIDRAITLKPSAAIYHVNRASALLALGKLEAAENGCRTALSFKRNCAEAYQVLGHVLSDLGHPEDAIAAYNEALRHRPDLPDLYNNLGLALRQANRLEEAAEAVRTGLRRVPDDAQALGNLAGVLKELARPSDSEASYRHALRLQPDDATLHVNLGVVLLLSGRLTEGWEEYEWRFRAGAAKLPPCDRPQWNGEPLGGRTLLVRAEQGLGDTIQFCRHVPLLPADGPLIFEVQPGLRRLMSSLPGTVQFVTVGETLPRFDLYCPLLSLPRLLGNKGEQVPYLTAEPDRITQWRDRLGTKGYRIGIAWQGNPASAAERGRSVPLHHFLPLAHVPGVRLISLQKQHGLEQLRAVPAGLRIETLGENFDEGPDAFIDTAALMQSLDLVVTSDTSVAHLAGALGCPVWVALKHVPDWRWQLEGDKIEWYPTMRLFRQTQRGDWEGVFARIAEQLANRLKQQNDRDRPALDEAADRDKPCRYDGSHCPA